MKKLLLAAMCMTFASNVNAADGADVKFNGEMRFRFTNVQNDGFVEAASDNATEQRTKVGIHFTKSEDLMAHVTLLNAATWGNAGTTNTSGELAADGTDGDNDVNVLEAWAFWKAMDNFSVRLGRGAMDIADGSVLAKNDWEQRPWAFEGVLGTWYTEWANINGFAVKGMNDDDDLTTVDADVNFYGASVDVKNLPEAIKMLNFHVLQSKATGITAAEIKDDKTRIGVTVKGDVSGFDYRGTYAMYQGEQKSEVLTETFDNEASMYDLEAGYTFANVMNMRVAALYHSDSGDKDAQDDVSDAGDEKLERYDPFFYDQHANAGLMDIVGWGNLTYIKVGFSLEPMEMTKVGADYYMFTSTEKADTTVGDATLLSATEDDVGSEIDLWATKTLSNGAELNARVGQFQGGDKLGTDLEDVTQISLGATFKF